MIQSKSLTANDSSVLGALFDPEATLSNSVRIEDSLPRGFLQASELLAVQAKEKKALSSINYENPSVGNVMSSISELTVIIQDHPMYAAAWNNRAQARRMLFKNEELPSHPRELQLIIDDLAQAIVLATPSPSPRAESPNGALSEADARVLAAAHTHRAFLLWLASRSEDLAAVVTKCVSGLQGVADKEKLEEMASREFSLGGRYGNNTAKQLAVRTNPYAKLCGSIVKEAMQKEIADYYQIATPRLGIS